MSGKDLRTHFRLGWAIERPGGVHSGAGLCPPSVCPSFCIAGQQRAADEVSQTEMNPYSIGTAACKTQSLFFILYLRTKRCRLSATISSRGCDFGSWCSLDGYLRDDVVLFEDTVVYYSCSSIHCAVNRQQSVIQRRSECEAFKRHSLWSKCKQKCHPTTKRLSTEAAIIIKVIDRLRLIRRDYGGYREIKHRKQQLWSVSSGCLCFLRTQI